jgi:hypothetical protein
MALPLKPGLINRNLLFGHAVWNFCARAWGTVACKDAPARGVNSPTNAIFALPAPQAYQTASLPDLLANSVDEMIVTYETGWNC